MFAPRSNSALPSSVRLSLVLLSALLVFSFAGCSDDGDDDLALREDLRTAFNLRTVDRVPYPPDNPAIAERVELGRLLFFDPILSGPDKVSCGHCHHPAFAWGDGSAFAVGVSGEVPGIGAAGVGPDRVVTDPFNFLTTPRNSPTCLNAGCSAQPDGEPHYLGTQFWDGRANGLEEQAKLPIESFDEMRGWDYVAPDAMEMVLEDLRGVPEYTQLFRAAFPEEAAEMDAFPERHVIRESTYARAVAAYQRELISVNSPYDRYVRGDDWALNEEQFEGMRLFFEKAQCGSCHDGPMFSSYEYAVTGVAQDGPGRDPASRGGDGKDWGREEHTNDPFDEYAFRVPSLRNIELTAPYFRTGAAASLREVMDFYNAGGNDEGLEAYRIDPRIVPLNLSEEEIELIIEFLEALSDRSINSPLVDPTVPLTVPSGLDPPVDWAPFSRVPAAGE